VLNFKIIMKIKVKLSVNFAVLFGVVLLIFSVLIYILASRNRSESFYRRLENRAFTNAKLLIDVKEVDSTLLKIIDKNTYDELFEEEIIIYNNKKEIIYSSEDFENFKISQEIFDNILNEKIFRSNYGNKDLVGLYYITNIGKYYVIALAYDKFGNQFITDLKLKLIPVYFLILIAISIISYFYSKSALSPLNNIIKQINKITANELNFRINEGNRKDEIAILAMNFNKMLDKLQNSFETQKVFLSGASHELRTPLTTIQGEIEVALLKERDNSEYREVLNSVLDEIKKLNFMTNSLLEIARTSVDFVDFTRNKIRIDEIIYEAENEVALKYPQTEILYNFIKLPDDERFVTVFGNENLLKIAIINIIDNACKYSENKTVKINLDFDELYFKVKIIDEGIGISQKEQSNMFDAFFRAENTKTIKGKGIGLSIVKKIIEIHNGEIIISSQLNVGTEVLLKLPILKNQF